MKMSLSAKPSHSRIELLIVCLQIYSYCAAQTPEAGRPAESPALTKIAGTVVNSITGMPLSQARVSISDTKNRANTRWIVTAEGGRFEFDHISTGKYSLVGAKRGYLTGAYEQHEQFSTAIVTGTEFDTTKLVLRLTPMASIEGKVVDEVGDPVREGQVTLYRENRTAGILRISPVYQERTNDLGIFEFAPLAPGKYFVSVTAKPWYAMHPLTDSADGTRTTSEGVDRSLDVTYPATYSGGATEADGALPIEVKGGDHTEIEIQLSPVPSLHLIYRVAEEDGSRGSSPPILERRVFDSIEHVPVNEMRRLSNGVYELSGVPAGTYNVRITEAGPQQVLRTSMVDLRNDGQELESSSGEPEGSLKLTIQMTQQEPLPKGLRIMLLDTQKHNRAFQEVDAKGEAAIESLPAGKYTIFVFSPGKPYSIVRTSSDAGQTWGNGVEVPAGGALTLTAVLATGSVNIEGFAKRGGKAASGVMVVLIPKEPGMRVELFRRDQSDSDGSFIMRDVIPGDYELVAIQDAWDLEWSKPGGLARYEEHAQTVTIPGGGQTTIQLPDPVEAQRR